MKPKYEHFDHPKYRYRLTENYVLLRAVFVSFTPVGNGYIHLNASDMTIKKGYAWDGATCTSDKHFIAASLVHDAHYQLMREGIMAKHKRKEVDKLMYDMCREDGMSWFRAQYVYRAVRLFGGWAI